MTGAPHADAFVLHPLSEVSRLIERRELSPRELTNATLRRIEALEPTLNAYLALAGEEAMRRADVADAEIASGRYRGPLHGVPLSLKDNIATAGLETTNGSPTMRGWRRGQQAEVARRLEQAGAIIVGKSHMFEFAYGAPNQAFGEIRNPWDIGRTPGGSSSGSAVSVAAGLCQGSIGTDTGGSIRIPAAFCGVVGLKPTYERVSREGVAPVSWSLDHVGPIARTVVDAALLYDAIGVGRVASASSAALAELEAGAGGLRVGVPPSRILAAADPEIAAAVEGVATILEEEGARVLELALPDLEAAATVMWVITGVEAADYHRERLARRSHELHPTVAALLHRGASLSGVDYVRAQRARRLLAEQSRQLFRRCDVLVCPTTAILPFALGAETVRIGQGDVDVQPAMNRFTPLFNLTGQPALSRPCGLSLAGLPIGAQLVASAFDEVTLLRAARAFERATPWHLERPRLEPPPASL